MHEEINRKPNYTMARHDTLRGAFINKEPQIATFNWQDPSRKSPRCGVPLRAGDPPNNIV